MSAFALVHGSWHGGWCWELMRAELAARGHTTVAPDLPITDPDAGAVAYADAVLAALAGNPKAVRAVGTACATNPLPVVVPCHRVVRSGGAIGNYAGGVEAKRILLELEAA